MIQKERIVGLEVNNAELEIFYQRPDGSIWSEFGRHRPFVLSPVQHTDSWRPLGGNSHYRFLKDFRTPRDAKADAKRLPDTFMIWDARESSLIREDLNYFIGLKHTEVSVLSFDIETTGLETGPDSQVLLISNTFRAHDGKKERKLFAYDQYANQGEMLEDWARWVREKDPTIICGHNIYQFDLPYMKYCADMSGVRMELGRDGSPLFIPDYESNFRRDASQFYKYQRARIYGREVIDTFFLAMKYDANRRQYESYALKSLIAVEGLEVKGRQHYDASNIAKCYKDPTEWTKIKAYAEHDADDALALYDLMAPPFFYLAQEIPKPFQVINDTATGSQLNSYLVRSYLRENHSLPKSSPAEEYDGAISMGNPGVYRNVFKVDVASLYPSIILQDQLYDKEKDPAGHFLKMMKEFTARRLENKRRAKETGDRSFQDLAEAQKIVVNSGYGMQGAPGLLFNSPTIAEHVTRRGREILQTAIDWANNHNFALVNADTDSISITYPGALWDYDERQEILAALNALVPERIRWEDDGTYDGVLVVKTKNYALLRDGKLKLKGHALKASVKEPALREFIQRLILLLLNGDGSPVELYHEYVREILTLRAIDRWLIRKTVTESIFSSGRKNERQVRDALDGVPLSMGDKFQFYYDKNDVLRRADQWTGDHSTERLLGKLFATVKVFETVLDTKQFPNYTLKRNQAKLFNCLDIKKECA